MAGDEKKVSESKTNNGRTSWFMASFFPEKKRTTVKSN